MRKISFRAIKEKIIKEEGLIFRRMRRLKRHHQSWFALIISVGLVFVWRGLWNLTDLLWFPHDPLWSNISGIILGGIILFLAHKLLNLLTGD
jgi:hypothetical protein